MAFRLFGTKAFSEPMLPVNVSKEFNLRTNKYSQENSIKILSAKWQSFVLSIGDG